MRHIFRIRGEGRVFPHERLHVLSADEIWVRISRKERFVPHAAHFPDPWRGEGLSRTKGCTSSRRMKFGYGSLARNDLCRMRHIFRKRGEEGGLSRAEGCLFFRWPPSVCGFLARIILCRMRHIFLDLRRREGLSRVKGCLFFRRPPSVCGFLARIILCRMRYIFLDLRRREGLSRVKGCLFFRRPPSVCGFLARSDLCRMRHIFRNRGEEGAFLERRVACPFAGRHPCADSSQEVFCAACGTFCGTVEMGGAFPSERSLS